MPKTLLFGTPFLAERPLYDHLLAPVVAARLVRRVQAVQCADDDRARQRERDATSARALSARQARERLTPHVLHEHEQLAHGGNFWMRGYDGGALAAYKIGPKEARLELVQFPLCQIPFYRRALHGWVRGLTELFCEKLHTKELPAPNGRQSMALRAQWV